MGEISLRNFIRAMTSSSLYPHFTQYANDLTNVWDVMFPVERYKFINEVVEKITVHIDRVEIEYKTDGLEAVITETEAANGKNN